MAGKKQAVAGAHTATIRVRALARGYYNHIQRRAGEEFLVIPVRMSDGTILAAKDQLSVDRVVEGIDPRDRKGERKVAVKVKGWMKVIGPGQPVNPQPAPLAQQTKAITDKMPKPSGEEKETGSLPDSEGGAPDGEDGEHGGNDDERDVI